MENQQSVLTRWRQHMLSGRRKHSKSIATIAAYAWAAHPQLLDGMDNFQAREKRASGIPGLREGSSVGWP